jgi:flagellar M-ring protein FliF
MLAGLRALGMARLAALGGVALVSLALLGFLVARQGQQPMALLYADLDLREAGQVVEQLTRQRIPHQIGGQGAQIMVPADQVARARMLLARDGLPSSGSIGYEIFDRGDGLTTTQFQQKIAETRALEGEIARTIRTLHGVRAARVHLVLPRREPFARERQEAQASVVLSMAGATRLDREGVQAVLNLVAAAVPGLRATNISIVDSRGTMLARAGQPTGATATAQGTEEIRRATELRLSSAVEEMLERTLGPGRVRAEAAVEMDFERINETQERYDPDGSVPRSTQSVTNSSRSQEANATVGVQNNLPNADAANANAGTQEQRQEETTNFELSRTVRTLVREQPQIKRISLAVMVDGIVAPGADGKPAWRALNDEELARITGLVRGAIGFNETRGDNVQVVSMRFAMPEEPGAGEAAGILGLNLDKSDLVKLAEMLLIGVIGLVALLTVLRPMVYRLTLAPPGAVALEHGAAAGAITGAGATAALAGTSGSELPALAGPDGRPVAAGEEPHLLADESMVTIGQVAGQMRATTIRRVAALVEKHPQETLTILRGWIAQEVD